MRMWNRGRNDAANHSSTIRCGCQHHAKTGKTNWRIEAIQKINENRVKDDNLHPYLDRLS